MNTSPITDHAGSYRGAIALVTDITERRALEQRLAADARRDPLTGVGNRNALFEVARRASSPADGLVAALYIDLDGFKQRQRRLRARGRRRSAAHGRGPAVRRGPRPATSSPGSAATSSSSCPTRIEGDARGVRARQPGPRHARRPISFADRSDRSRRERRHRVRERRRRRQPLVGRRPRALPRQAQRTRTGRGQPPRVRADAPRQPPTLEPAGSRPKKRRMIALASIWVLTSEMVSANSSGVRPSATING